MKTLPTVVDGGVDEIDGGIDEIDGNTQTVAPLPHATTHRFSEKSPAEKEVLYEHIASRLISIGDSYNISTPANPTHAGDDAGEHCGCLLHMLTRMALIRAHTSPEATGVAKL